MAGKARVVIVSDVTVPNNVGAGQNPLEILVQPVSRHVFNTAEVRVLSSFSQVAPGSACIGFS